MLVNSHKLFSRYLLNEFFFSILFQQSGIKKHECPDCHKKFSLGTEMRVHQRIHDKTGAYKKHICSVCDKRFIKNHLLKKHLEKEHGVMEFRETMEPLV